MQATKNNIEADLKKEMQRRGLSNRQTGRMLGVSATTISQIINGRYNIVPELENKIMDFLNSSQSKENQKEATHSVTTLVETSTYKKVLEAINIMYVEMSIGVIYGEAGIGKSRALKEFKKEMSRTILIQATPAYTAKELFKALHIRLGGDGKGTLNGLFNEVVQHLSGSERVVIIDEAENLPNQALDMLRRLWDMTKDDESDEGTISLVLVGLERLLYNLKGKRGEFSQLYSRVAIAVKLGNLRENDTKKFLKEGVKGGEEYYKMFHELSGGNIRTLKNLLKRSITISNINNIQLSEKAIKTANKQLVK